MDAEPVTYRRFDDIGGQRSDIYDMAQKAIGQMKPLSNASHQLEISDVGYDDNGYDPDTAEEKKALLNSKSLQRPLKGTVALKDTAGNVLDQQRMTLAQIPHLNSRGLFIRDGTVYNIRNQLRLRPGVYTRTQKNGDTESHFNVQPGTGRSFRIEMGQDSGLFKLKVDQSTTRLYPVLRALGVSDDDMKQTWGDELFQKNYRQQSGKDDMDMSKIVRKLGKDMNVPTEQLPQVLGNILQRAGVDEDTSELTLGERIKNLSAQTLLKATGKQLKVARGEVPPDNRDSQAFQSFHAPQDLLAERLRRDPTGALRQAFWKASRTGSLKGMLPGVLNKNVDSLFNGSGLSMPIEDINPLETVDARQAITRLGEGGIASNDSISRDARNVQSSYAGVIDPTRAPECYDSKTEVMTELGWKPWPLITKTDRLACLINGSLAFYEPTALYAKPHTGKMFGVKNNHIDYLVTPNHRMLVRCPGRLKSGKKCGWLVHDAASTFGRVCNVMSSGFGPLEGISNSTAFTLPVVKALGGERVVGNKRPPVGAALNKPVASINMGDWAEFLGWYLSEGSVQTSKGHYVTNISQDPKVNADNVEEIKALLDRLPFAWSLCVNSFSICGKQLAMYLSQFGKSDTKYVPDYIFTASVDTRKRFLRTLMLGDGRSYKGQEKRTFCSGSRRLVDDVARLTFSLGMSSNLAIYIDKRKESYLPVHELYLHTRNERVIRHSPQRRSISDHYIVEDFDGMVYCATVPGGLLYVRRNECCGFWCGNSSNIGVDLRMTDAAMRGSDNQLYTTVKNLKTGQAEVVSAHHLASKTVTFPGEINNEAKRIPAIRGDKITYVPKEEADYEIMNSDDMMSRATRLIPFPEGIKGQRLLMGGRMSQQAVPLQTPEAPHVQTADVDGTSLYKSMGKQVGAQFSPADGIVTKVTPDYMLVTSNNGVKHKVDLYNNYPMARKTVLHNTPLVEPGTLVKAGQPLASSNFTDKEGTFSIGRNLRTAYMSAEGDTIEDAFVISESAAKKLGAEAMYKTDLDKSDVNTTNKGDYNAIFAGRFKPAQLNNLDDNGVIQPGMIVQKGDPLVLGVGNKPPAALGALMKSPKSSVTDKTQVWEHAAPGIVTDVVNTKNGIRVLVKSYDTTNVGDKLSGQYGNKGVAATVRPDDQMPLGEDGKPIEVIMNTNGVVSRVNPSALASSLLGKIVERTGRAPYAIRGFNTPEGVADFVLNEAQKHGVNELETVTDPRDGRKIPGIFVGNSYIMRLQHKAEGKLSARDQAGYTVDDYPARGGSEGAKRISLLDSSALLAAGATNFLKDAKLARGQRNDDYWRQMRHGETPMLPGGSFADEQFKTMLKAAGVNVREYDTKEQLRPLLDTDVAKMAPHEVQNGGTFDFETMQPVKGGLFDIGTTGGAGGNQFARITLPVKIPHPLFMDPIQRLLGLTGKGMEAVLSGKEELNGLTGPDAIEKGLKDIDVPREMENAKTVIRSGKGATRDLAIKRLHYLAGLQAMHVEPEDLMVSKIAVIPPKYRPVVRGKTTDVIHDMNYLYKDLLEAKKNYVDAKSTFGDSNDEYLTMLKAVSAVSGVGDPVNPKTAEQGVKGILRYAIGLGDSPKTSAYQRKVIGASVDTVGRSVITADRQLGMDDIGVPEEMAWSIFKPYIVRRLAQNGLPPAAAVQEVEDRTPAASAMLDEEMKQRPVVYNRAPALHRYAYTGGWGQRVKGDAIHMPYYTLKTLGADYDGDAINIHVPSTPESVNDVKEKMMPSKNLYFTGNFETHYEPMQDYTAGLYLAGKMDPKQKPITFATKEEAKAAYARGAINARTPIRILQA